MTITTLPPAPSRADAANADTFNAVAETFVAALPVFSTQVNDTLTAVNSAASGAIASSNFKGDWSSLTGALSIPASTRHSGALWLLVANTSDVTADEPGVSSKWADMATFSGNVSLVGDQTIAGNKTFTDDVVANSFTGDGSGLTNVASLGVGQTWQSVTRSPSTNYQNTTGKPITLAYSIFGGTNNVVLTNLSIGASTGSMVTIFVNRIPAVASDSGAVMITGIIPNDYYYSFSIGAGNSVNSTYELR